MNRPWFKFIVKILNDCGLSIILYQQNVNIQWLKKTVFHILLDQFKQSWNSEMYNSSKGINYRIFKTTLSLEKYLLDLPYKYQKSFCMFRTSNAKLPIERGRWYDIPRENRICTICNCIEIGDEFHYLFHCTDITI